MLDLSQIRGVLSQNSTSQRDADPDELEYLQQFLPEMRHIHMRWHVDGPGNWIIIYATEGDFRVCCFASYGEYGEPDPCILWDKPA